MYVYVGDVIDNLCFPVCFPSNSLWALTLLFALPQPHSVSRCRISQRFIRRVTDYLLILVHFPLTLYQYNRHFTLLKLQRNRIYVGLPCVAGISRCKQYFVPHFIFGNRNVGMLLAGKLTTTVNSNMHKTNKKIENGEELEKKKNKYKYKYIK